MENKAYTTVEKFIRSENYGRASRSESPEEKCKNCSALFVFKGKTRCYAYEQQRFKDNTILHPRRDFNCSLFDDTGALDYIVSIYKKALAIRPDPENDPEYIECLRYENEYYMSLSRLEQETVRRKSDNSEEWDDPNTYANCSDLEDESGNCYSCADDECPMNMG